MTLGQFLLGMVIIGFVVPLVVAIIVAAWEENR